MGQPLVLSYIQVRPILRAGQEGERSARTSPDLGLSEVEVSVGALGAVFPGGQLLSWEALGAIARAESRCFVIEEGRPRPIEVFSEEDSRLYSLMPTHRAPTLLISGIPMHRIKDVDPWEDTRLKVRTLRPVVGPVLDTATGLGYTAIQASKTAEQVTTIELSPATLEVAHLNPWSRPLFDNPKILQLTGDAFDLVRELGDGAFSRIIHDPPVFRLAGDLYSAGFYRQLYRLLGRGGRLFHYIGDLQSRSGRGVARGAARRLEEAGFRRVIRRPEAFGLLALK